MHLSEGGWGRQTTIHELPAAKELAGVNMRLAAKDLRLVMEAAAARDRHLKQAQANRAWMDEAEERGAADLDRSAVVATTAANEQG